MAFNRRIKLYKELEATRQRPLIVYVTSMRRNSDAQIARDAIPEILSQLQALPKDTAALDLLIASNGGDGTVAWRIVSLLRERVEKFSVLVPQAAFSAATLIALGADEILMHPHGNLGPTDPQITNHAKGIQFGSEDLAAFLKFAKDEVGLTDQLPMLELFKQFCAEVGFVGIGVAARSAQLTQAMGEKLLRLHMKSESQLQKAKLISEALNTKFFHHGYPVSRSEADEIGLPVAKSDPVVEELIWNIWLDIEEEMQLREPFSPLACVHANPACAALFAPAVAGAPAAPVPATKCERISAIMESSRYATRHIAEAEILAARQPDLKLQVSFVPLKEGWRDVVVPSEPTKNPKKASSQSTKAEKKVK